MSSDAEIRRAVFQHMNDMETQLGVSFFAIVLCPDVYIYHKRDSTEFSMALANQSVTSMMAGISQFEFEAPSGKLIVNKCYTFSYMWFSPLRRRLQQVSKTKNWRWFVVVFEDTKMLLSAESFDFPLEKECRARLLDDVCTLWNESRMADVAYAKDSYKNTVAEVGRVAALKHFSERVGIRKI